MLDLFLNYGMWMLAGFVLFLVAIKALFFRRLFGTDKHAGSSARLYAASSSGSGSDVHAPPASDQTP